MVEAFHLEERSGVGAAPHFPFSPGLRVPCNSALIGCSLLPFGFSLIRWQGGFLG
ncbi:MAG: hypothetical protein ACI8PT_003848 [Gammaproteobacteria bacterium]|jgi:hypothetical protein